MSKKLVLFEISDASSAAASTTLVGKSISGLEAFDFLNIDVQIVGATGGPVDVYLQKRIKANVWADFAHFPQVAAGTTKAYNVSTDEVDATPIAIGIGTDAAPGVVLAANAMAHGHPGSTLRVVTVTGVGVTVAATLKIYITAKCRN